MVTTGEATCCFLGISMFCSFSENAFILTGNSEVARHGNSEQPIVTTVVIIFTPWVKTRNYEFMLRDTREPRQLFSVTEVANRLFREFRASHKLPWECFFVVIQIRINDPRSFGSCCIKVIDESLFKMYLLVSLMRHDRNNLTWHQRRFRVRFLGESENGFVISDRLDHAASK